MRVRTRDLRKFILGSKSFLEIIILVPARSQSFKGENIKSLVAGLAAALVLVGVILAAQKDKTYLFFFASEVLGFEG